MFVSKNTSPFLAEAFVFTDKRGKKSSIAVVRATFDVRADGSATVSDIQTPFFLLIYITVIRQRLRFNVNRILCQSSSRQKFYSMQAQWRLMRSRSNRLK